MTLSPKALEPLKWRCIPLPEPRLPVGFRHFLPEASTRHEIHAHEVHAYEVHAREVHACEMRAHEVHTREMHAYEVHAREVRP